MPMRTGEMKKVLGIYSNSDQRWSADLPSLTAVKLGYVLHVPCCFNFFGEQQCRH